MRFLLRSLIGIVLFIAVLVAIAFATGNEHLIRGVRSTYLIGRTAPDIDDRDIFPTEKIAAGTAIPWPKAARFGKIALNADQERTLTGLGSAGFVIVQDDSLLFEHYWNDWDAGSVVNSFSVAKSYIGLLTGIALREGVIKDIHQKVGEFIPEFATGCYAKIDLWHLLTMSTGLDWSETGKGPFDDDAKGYYGYNVRRLSFEQPCRDEPGSEFDYISGSTQIMAEVLEIAYGKQLDQLVHEKIWVPLGAESDAWWAKDRRNGDFKAFCCLYATNRDFARLGQVYLDSGRWKGEELITKEYWLNSITPAPLTDDGKPNKRYGYFWWLAEVDGRPVHYARGFHGQYIISLPTDRLVIVRTGSKRGVVDDDGHPVDLYDWIRIARELAGPFPSGPHIAADTP